MTFFFDLTPFIVAGIGLGLLILAFIAHTIYLILKAYIFIPLKHKKTGLKLYYFEKTAYGTVTDEAWLKNDDEAKKYQSRYDFYSFRTKEIYPKLRYLETKEIIN